MSAEVSRSQPKARPGEGILQDILRRKREEVEARRIQTPWAELQAQLSDRPATRGFRQALSFPGSPLKVIAEVKRRSPSAGTLKEGLDAVALARRYAQAGAACISVLTDGPGFGGSLEDLAAVRAAVEVPLLRKDFVVDSYQLLEARAFGADAVLLLANALSPSVLKELLERAAQFNLDALVECHTEAEVEVALSAGANLVGINNRNLSTFEVSLQVSEKLLPLLPSTVRGVAESGVRSLEDATFLRKAGAANLLIGEALVRSEDPGVFLRDLGALP